jgi:hypothetical protein
VAAAEHRTPGAITGCSVLAVAKAPAAAKISSAIVVLSRMFRPPTRIGCITVLNAPTESGVRRRAI